MKRKFMGLIIILQLLNSCSNNGNSGIAVNTFGSLLNGLFERANQLIQQAQTSGLLLEVNGGAQVQNLIISAKEAYKDDLNTTMSALTSQQQQVISAIDGILNKVQSGISEVTADLTQIALILPLSNKFPQLRKYKGTVVSPTQNSIIVELSGVFLDVPTDGYDAVIKMGNKTFKSILKTTQELKFSIPKSEFHASNEKIDYIPFDIFIDYKKRGLLFASKEVATFKLYFVQLPRTFGTVFLETTQTVDTTFFEVKTCGPLTWNTHSGNDDGVPKGCAMEGGWICDVSSVHPVSFRGEEGRMNIDWFDRGNASSPTAAMWDYLATTKHGIRGNYGGLTVDLQYKRYKTTQVKRTTATPAQALEWGDEKVLIFDPKEQWKLTFMQFDGKKKEIASSDQLSPYLKVNTIANRIEIKLAPFDF